MAKKKKKKLSKQSKLAKKLKGKQSDPKSLEREGQKHFATGNYAGAISTWNHVIKLRGGNNHSANQKLLPKLAQANFLYSKALSNHEAIPYLQAAVYYEPDNSQIISVFLRICRECNKLEELKQLCRELIVENRCCYLYSRIIFFLEWEENNAIPEKFDKTTINRIKCLKQIESKNFLHATKQLSANNYHLLLQAIAYFQNNQHRQAEELLQKIIATNSSFSIFAHNYLALIYLTKDIVQAEKNILSSICYWKENPEMINKRWLEQIARLCSHLAFYYIKQQKLEKAARFWQQAFELAPKNRTIAFNLDKVGNQSAIMLAREGNIEKALHFWHILYKKQTNNPVIAKNIAIAYQHLEDYKQSLFYWEKAVFLWQQKLKYGNDVLQIKHRLVNIYEQIANCHKHCGHGRQVGESYRKIIEIDPQNYPIKSKLAEYYLEKGKPEEAYELLEELLEVEPDNATYITNMGIAAYINDSDDQASLWWKKTLTINDQEKTAKELLCRYYFQKTFDDYLEENFSNALSALKDLLELKPNSYRGLTLKGTVLYQQDFVDQAKQSFSSAIACAPESPEVYLEAGDALLHINKVDDAKKYFAEAQKYSNENFPLQEVLMQIGMIYTQKDVEITTEEAEIICRNEENCNLAQEYYHQSIASGNFETAMAISEFLLEVNCQKVLTFSEKAHELDPKSSLPLLHAAMYHLRHQDFTQFQKILERAQNTPDYEENQEMQNFLTSMHKLGDMAKVLSDLKD